MMVSSKIMNAERWDDYKKEEYEKDGQKVQKKCLRKKSFLGEKDRETLYIVEETTQEEFMN